ncbi:MAG: HEAT repeat domain-containing protein, partial [Pirellulales bacterium]
MSERMPLLLLILAVSLLIASRGPCDEHLPGIVFVADEIFGPKFEGAGNARPGTNHWRDGYLYHRATTQHPLERTTTPTRPGSNLYTLVPARPDGTLTRITHLTSGAVFDPEPSYDGQRILFSMRRDGEDWFNLYEMGANGSDLAQLTDGPFNDVSGVYLPDGRIVFVSDRAGYLEEYHEERTETLWVMNGDGTNIRQLTFNPGTVFDPTVLSDGRILFSLWDTFMLNIPPGDKHETYLMTIRPDGTEEGHFFGAGQYRFFNRERHSGVAMTQTGQMPDGTILVQTELGPSILNPSQGPTLREALHPVFPGTTSVQLGGATHRVHLSPTGSRSTPYPLPDGRFLFSGTLPGARDIAIYVADPKTRQTRLLFNDPASSEFDARPILLDRPRPAMVPAKGPEKWGSGSEEKGKNEDGPQRVGVTGRARLVVLHARRSDDPEKEKVLHRARYLRVVEALPTAVTSSSHTSLATRILGVVPICSDGSAYCEVPSNTALFVEPLDAAGRRLEYEWRHPETSVPVGSRQILMEMTYTTAQTGEVKSCHGCHAPQEEAASQAGLARALALSHPPVPIQRDTTDLMYRRNEPDEYRCQARIGEAPIYRAWLASSDADLRRRACELLMEMEDEARRDAAAIARLLADETVTARRAAALALTRLGCLEQTPALLKALADADWQVRFHAASALESITACRPTVPTRLDDLPKYYERWIGPRGMARWKASMGEGPEALRSFAEQTDPDRIRRWYEAIGRWGRDAPESARRKVREALQIPMPPPITFEPRAGKRHALEG